MELDGNGVKSLSPFGISTAQGNRIWMGNRELRERVDFLPFPYFVILLVVNSFFFFFCIKIIL